jgi:glycosidase
MWAWIQGCVRGGNHDRRQRIRHPSSPDAEVRLCLALLYVLPGIPCLYYGTEQGGILAPGPDSRKPAVLPGASPGFFPNCTFRGIRGQFECVATESKEGSPARHSGTGSNGAIPAEEDHATGLRLNYARKLLNRL